MRGIGWEKSENKREQRQGDFREGENDRGQERAGWLMERNREFKRHTFTWKMETVLALFITYAIIQLYAFLPFLSPFPLCFHSLVAWPFPLIISPWQVGRENVMDTFGNFLNGANLLLLGCIGDHGGLRSICLLSILRAICLLSILWSW